jgi:hypothetical protein
MKCHELIINGEINTFVSRETYEKLPKDSMLFALLRDDQPLRTQNRDGKYELILDHPKLFDVAVQSAFDESFGFASMNLMLTSAGYDFKEGLDGLAETMNYLGLLPNKHVGVIIASTTYAKRYNLRLVQYQALLEQELQNYGTEMIGNFARKLESLEKRYSTDKVVRNPFVKDNLHVVFTMPLRTKGRLCMVGCKYPDDVDYDFSFTFNFLPSCDTENLYDGDFMKIYWKKQPKVFENLLYDHVVCLLVHMIESVSNYDYEAGSLTLNHLQTTGVIKGLEHKISESYMKEHVSKTDYIVVDVNMRMLED